MEAPAMTRLVSVLTIAIAFVGCQKNSQEPDPTADALTELKDRIGKLEQSVASLHKALQAADSARTTKSDDSAPQALAFARDKLAANDYVSAYDFLVAAIRLAPSSPQVFDATLEFVNHAAQSDDDQALDLAYALYAHLAGLIPFQPLPDISSARQKYLDAGNLFSPADSGIRQDPLESIRDSIATMTKGDMPHPVASIVAQAIRSDLEVAAVAILDDPPVSTHDSWQDWNDLQKQLDHFERQVLMKMYVEIHDQFALWDKNTTKLLQPPAASKGGDQVSIGDAILAEIRAGYRLRSSMVPFVESELSGAKTDQQKLDTRLERLERTREWIYNQDVLATIGQLRERADLAPLEKLRRLATYDERRLSPYVLQRHQEEWNQWFEELDDEEQKVEATKIRVLGEIVQ
jgi:hypothetical protein